MNMKRLVLILVLCIIPFSLPGQTRSYRVSGNLRFQSRGDIYVYLVTEEDFKIPFTGIQVIHIKMESDGEVENEAYFSFDNVEAGTYGIRCFQDKNGNGKLDKGIGGPAEPWGMSWQGDKPKKWPRFSHIAFEVTQDIVDMYITLQQ